MHNYTIDQLALMPEDRALRTFFGMRNYGLLVWLWPVSLVAYFGFFVNSAFGGSLVEVAISTIGLAALALLFFSRSSARFEESFEFIHIGFMILVPLGIVFMADDLEFRSIFTATLTPLFFLATRMRKRHLLLVAAVYVVTSVTGGFAQSAGAFHGEAFFPPIMANAIFAGTSMFITRRRRIAFLEDWRHAARREHERERMKEEIADARKIQLAMLPAAPPDIPWLDISSVSVPATEVGGDFYEYFRLDEDRVVIAIGDVAGHGVGSGLVLAGIKSGLHLLREELVHPVEAVRRLNRVASEWLQWRMLVTLLIAVVDRRERVIRVVCAGHPPMLIARGVTCHEVGNPALPLGTRLDPVFSEQSFEIEDGDTLLVYTDGVTEMQNPEGDVYDDVRLRSILLEASSKHETAREVRDPILSDISYFKDKAQQLDDLSFVVARIGTM